MQKFRPLKPLVLRDVVQVHNQQGQHANKWDLSVTVMEVQGFDSCLVKMDGTGWITKRNGRYLWPIISFTQSQTTRLPLQQFTNELQRQTDLTKPAAQTNYSNSNVTMTGQVATGNQTAAVPMPTAHALLKQQHQVGTHETTHLQPKRVTFKTKYFIQEF